MSRRNTPEEAKIPTVPNQPKTPVRTFRLADDLWQRLKATAAKEGVTVSDLLRRIVERHLGEKR